MKKINGNEFRLSPSTQRRWKDYPEISEKLDELYSLVYSTVLAYRTLSPTDIRDITSAIMSEAASDYPMAKLSSILNKLRVDMADFINFIEIKFPISSGHQFLGVRAEISHYENISQYAHFFSEMKDFDGYKNYIEEIDSKNISKTSKISVYQMFREALFGIQEFKGIKENVIRAIKDFPEIFSESEYAEFNKHSNFVSAFIQLCADEEIEPSVYIASSFMKLAGNMHGYDYSEAIIKYLSEKQYMSDAEKRRKLVYACACLMDHDTSDPMVYFETSILKEGKEIPLEQRWAVPVAGEHAIKNFEVSWSNFSFEQAILAHSVASSDQQRIAILSKAYKEKSFVRATAGSTDAELESLKNFSDAVDLFCRKMFFPLITKNTDFTQYPNNSIEDSVATSTVKSIINYMENIGHRETCVKAIEHAYAHAVNSTDTPGMLKIADKSLSKIVEITNIGYEDFKTNAGKKRFIESALGM